MNPQEVRLLLLKGDFDPVPVKGKAPVIKDWQARCLHLTGPEIELWGKSYPFAQSTGALTERMPTLDIDILDEQLVEEIEQLVSDEFEEHGDILPRIGRAPKRAIPFRTDEPFPKISVNLIAPDGSLGQKIEFLSAGQQVVVHGKHPDTKKPYAWPKGALKAREELPYIREAQAIALVEEKIVRLAEARGYTRVELKPRRQPQPNGEAAPGASGADWSRYAHVEDHEVLAAFALALLNSGMHDGAAVTFLRGQVSALKGQPGIEAERIKRRLKEIPAMVRSARDILDAEADAKKPTIEIEPPSPTSLDGVMQAFRKWLTLEDEAPVYAVIGAVVANMLPGDPVWLGIIAPPSSAKTEILNSLSQLPFMHGISTVTPQALLSGTPKHQKSAGAKGGVLREMGQFGILVFKDFGSVLSMRPDAKGELLAALREIYDGRWIRRIGGEGGRTLDWAGKAGLLFGVTQSYDQHYAVIGALGDRFLTIRQHPSKGQFAKALEHRGGQTKVMRDELATAVAGLFSQLTLDAPEISDEERDRLTSIVRLVLALRAHVGRDRVTREIEAIHEPEGEARIGLCLERLLAGLMVLGLERHVAMTIVERVAFDSTVPTRLNAFRLVAKQPAWTRPDDQVTTRAVAQDMGFPTNTARRFLEDLAAQGLLIRTRAKDETGDEKQGGADLWAVHPDWEDVAKFL
jgi:hypothetical protein